jgi:hypothetical protein
VRIKALGAHWAGMGDRVQELPNGRDWPRGDSPHESLLDAEADICVRTIQLLRSLPSRDHLDHADVEVIIEHPDRSARWCSGFADK